MLSPIQFENRFVQSMRNGVATGFLRPWSVAKGFDTFLPISEPVAPRDGADPNDWQNFELWLSVNGEERQRCLAGHMIHPIPKILRYIGSVMTLEPGDLVITGTPSGVRRLCVILRRAVCPPPPAFNITSATLFPGWPRQARGCHDCWHLRSLS